MEKLSRLTPFISVSPQVVEPDLGIIAAQGFKAIIGNRARGESEDQPAGADFAEAARRNGLDFRHVPVVSGKLSDENMIDLTAALAELKGPVLAFCRTGARSATLWALSEAHHPAPKVILSTAKAVGHDLEALRPRRPYEPGAHEAQEACNFAKPGKAKQGVGRFRNDDF